MELRKKKWYLYLILTIVLITYIVFICRYNTAKETVLEEVKLKEENIINNKNFAIMVEKSDGSGYEEADTFPSGIPLNTNLSGCIDTNGKIINGALSYQDGKVKVYVNSTAYCYLYFSNDDVAPIVSLSVINNETENAQLVITSNETGTYCVNTSSTKDDMSNCTFTGTIYGKVSLTTNIVSENGTYYVHVKDGGNNIGISNEVKVKLSNAIPFGNYLLENPTLGLNTSTPYNGMYRYIGSTADNYVSIDGVLYRIIGITSEANSTLRLEAGQIKLIKLSSVKNGWWHSNSKTNTQWESSAMYTYLQGSDVLGNISVIPSEWVDKISSVRWYIGDVSTSVQLNGSSIAGYEDNLLTNGTSKIGLMYLSDYYYSNKNWMTLGSDDWTMTRCGYYSSNSDYRAWYIGSSGYTTFAPVTVSNSVRPVFYLTSDVSFVSGTGLSTDPFIIS